MMLHSSISLFHQSEQHLQTDNKREMQNGKYNQNSDAIKCLSFEYVRLNFEPLSVSYINAIRIEGIAVHLGPSCRRYRPIQPASSHQKETYQLSRQQWDRHQEPKLNLMLNVSHSFLSFYHSIILWKCGISSSLWNANPFSFNPNLLNAVSLYGPTALLAVFRERPRWYPSRLFPFAAGVSKPFFSRSVHRCSC